jgi:hypothetical protein
MQIAPPAEINFGFYNGYIGYAIGADLITVLENNWKDIQSAISPLTEQQLLMRYEADKWNIKEVMVHLVDSERNFCYRIMRFSRQEQTPLPMFDIHKFIINAHASERDIKDILLELELLRRATIIMFKGMPEFMLELTGPARDAQLSVRALGFAIAGHCMHHLNVIKERYLQLEVIPNID